MSESSTGLVGEVDGALTRGEDKHGMALHLNFQDAYEKLQHPKIPL
jgi:hypothetical protein